MVTNLFKIFLFLIPLVFFKNTSELFEFNKIIVLYIATSLIVVSWAIKSIKNKSFFFRRTILDWPLLIFLSTQLISTLLSIDPRTSVLGYYSRFNGGFASILCYGLLYWAFVSNVDKKQLRSILNYTAAGLIISSLLALLEHFNIGVTCGLMGLGWDTSCWVQDVQSRVFSTFGQPNWLAAYLVAFSPIIWAMIIKLKSENHSLNIFSNSKGIFYLLTSSLFFMVLLFTKSRSGILGFGVCLLVFWGFLFLNNDNNFKKTKEKTLFLKEFLTINFLFLLITISIGTPWTKSLFVKKNTTANEVSYQGPALETGGTESGKIRMIVWEGALNIWRSYPIFGTGVETFALSYPGFKPQAHNLVSEWDFIYNKAHNEYLNYLATTGSLGLLAYISLISFSAYLMYIKKEYGFLAGYLSILVTNFFGFSVVSVSVLTYLFPAMATVAALTEQKKKTQKRGFSFAQKNIIGVLILVLGILLYFIIRYWYSDILFNRGKAYNRSDNFISANQALQTAIKLNPSEPIFWSELGVANAEIALLFQNQNEPEKAKEFSNSAVTASEKAIGLSPSNQNYKKIYSGVLTKMSAINKDFLYMAISVLDSAISKAPTDPKLRYQLGLVYLKTGQNQKGLGYLQNAVELKPNYKEARFALGLTYKDLGQIDEAKGQLEYILRKIDPKDELSKKYLNELN